MRQCRLSKPGKANAAARIGVLAVNGGKLFFSTSKKITVGLPGLFDADVLEELTEEDCFLGPMKRAIIKWTTHRSISSHLIWPNSGPKQLWLKTVYLYITNSPYPNLSDKLYSLAFNVPSRNKRP